ncbi:hypothetical protein VaNZ11_006633 [Volvox africanus]|uniref:Nudix hydrolase domain-containing protein n=1 Tax=Volvox africanus TaxID=51714 RepID=A0ABQ5S161_9CHLO|nr:hypothetical protein VaNZ11_006633 [Volvox africanus]
MAGFVHGLSVHGPRAVITKELGEMFNQTLPEDLTNLLTWVNENPKHNLLTAVVAKPAWDYPLITALRSLGRTCYIIVWHSDATEDGIARIQAFQSGANMVTNNPEHLHEALQRITVIHGTGNFSCPWCELGGFSEHELWRHQPLYHIYEPDKLDARCPACRNWTSRLTRHINLYHGPTQLVDERTGVFALAVVRRPEDGKFLMVQERYGEGYWLPGGGVDTGESLRQGAIREAWEEAGADIAVTGILTVESFHHGSWRRIIFLAEPVPFVGDRASGHRGNGGAAAAVLADPTPAVSDTDSAAVRAASAIAAVEASGSLWHRYRCKTLPDLESAGACWVTVQELEGLPLRNASEPLTWIPWVAGGGRVLPVDAGAVPEVARVFPDFQL